jgi:YidC/Oxa1 family membrane protein insertase
VAFAAGGVAFPIGVLVYWTTTNVWTMGQQFYVIRRNPAPGTPAFDAKLARDRAKGRVTEVVEEEALLEASQQPVQRQRQQPKKQTREQRRKAANRPPKTDSGATDDIEEGNQA